MNPYHDAACLGQAELMLSHDRRRDPQRMALCRSCPVFAACQADTAELERSVNEVTGWRAGRPQRDRVAAFVSDRTLNPRTIRLVALLTEQGKSAREIGYDLDISDRTVQRYRAAYRELAEADAA